MNTKLILVEGLPGSGKTTTAQLINEIAAKKDIETEIYLEGNLDHPADYDGVAYFSRDEFTALLALGDKNTNLLMETAIMSDSSYFVPYKKMGAELGDDLLSSINKHDIYELPLELHIELITAKWEAFAKTAIKSNKTYIFECCFIQNPVTMGMVKCGAPKEKVIAYVRSLLEIIKSLNPVLVYVDQDDIEHSFKKAIKERPKEWSVGFMQYYNEQGYGKEHNVTGLEGTLEVLKARNELEKHIFEELEMEKVKVNNSQFDNEKYKKELTDALNKLLVG